eukprot:TRINITY_DN20258_c0_g1_i1.p1 TRINITY_DN20258_c0_g1~~TRINITY_DN20258_c0_g1_i1.p1  ORF type:complete len:348 (+),score=109.87 TRINITY_DN20258_c0_g1_i1:266-1309(+)
MGGCCGTEAGASSPHAAQPKRQQKDRVVNASNKQSNNDANDVFSKLPPLAPPDDDDAKPDDDKNHNNADKDAKEDKLSTPRDAAKRGAGTDQPESPPTLSPEASPALSPSMVPGGELERKNSAKSVPSLSRSPTPQLAVVPFNEDVIVFESPSTAMLCGVDSGFILAGQRNSELARVKLHSTLTATPIDVDYYYIPPQCILSSFAHVRLSKLVPSDTPLRVRCAEESDMIIAIHQDNPLCLHSDFQRVMTNNSYSRFLASSGSNRALQKWYRLYHRHLSPGTHEIVFSTEYSWKGSSMNQFTIFVRPSSCSPSLVIKPLADDSPQAEDPAEKQRAEEKAKESPSEGS